MTKIKYTEAGSAVTTPLDNTRRTEIRLANAPVCWDYQYAFEVFASCNINYYQTSTLQGEPYGNESIIEYQLLVNFIGSPYVMVRVRFGAKPAIWHGSILAKAPDPTASQVQTQSPDPAIAEVTSARFIKAVNKTWHNRFRLEITDPACGSVIVPVRYVAVRDDARPHYVINAVENLEREALKGSNLWLSPTTKHNTFVHEFAHCIGLPDEYSTQDGVTLKVNYTQPNGTKGEDIICYPPPAAPPGGHRLMTTGVPIFLERHAWPVAIDTQRFLKMRLGRNISCRVLLA